MKSVALVTCSVLPEPDPDQEPLLEALRAAGLTAHLLAWDATQAEASRFGLLVLRSCWNHHIDPLAFLAWIERAAAATRLLNPAAIVAHNQDKRYLRDLEERDLPVVPTVFVELGERADFARTLAQRGWAEAVVKPAVSAASYRTRRFVAGDPAAQFFLDDLARDRVAMIQPYLAGVERTGERALVWIAGEWTHAVKKSPRFDGADEEVSDALSVTDAERALGDRALGDLAADLLYARLDLIPADDGTPLISELELIEPSLFLVQHPPALTRLVSAIGAALER